MTIAYACIYISIVSCEKHVTCENKKRGREPLSEKEEKRGGQRPRKSKRKEKKKNNKAEGLSKKKKARSA